METLQNSPIQLAGTQEPLLHKRQIIPGVILAGRMATYVWKVLEVDDDIVTCVKMPTSLVACVHQYTLVPGGEACTCGMRRQPMKDFLPVVKGKARFHMISLSDGLLQMPNKYAVYAYVIPGGTKTVTVHDGKWSEPVPLVPVLHKVWELPDALRAICDEASGAPTPLVAIR